MDSDDNIIYSPKELKIKLVKWRVREGFPVNNSQVILLYENYDEENDKGIKRFRAHKAGVVKKRLYEDGAIIEKGSALLELCECIHATVIKDMCADCGADLRQNENGHSEASVPMIHSVPDLKVTQKLAQQLGQADTKRLLEDRKLVLLVDLDQTLIHTTNDNVPNNIKGIYHFRLYGPNSPWYHTKLRPFALQFLNNIAPYFELHICTFGARNYAHMIAQILDPDGKLFSHRILSRDECFNVTYKTDNLKALFPCGDAMVCIIDDREDVWNMVSNLIQVKPYHFFQHTGDINAPPELSKHELDGKGVDFKDLSKKKEQEDETEIKEKEPEKENLEKPKENVEINDIIEKKDENIEQQSCSSENESSACNDEKTEEFEEIKSKYIENKITDKNEDEIKSTENIKPTENEKLEISKKTENTQTKSDVKDKEKLDSKQEQNSSDREITLTSKENEIRLKEKDNDFIEIEDPDDYLLYLENILMKIHKRFYEIYDEKKLIPDLKVLIPQIRSKVLEGLNLVFSGLVPNQMRLEQSRAYLIAKSLGANVTQLLTEDTTHLVAVSAGTFKYNAVRKRPDIFIVTPDWLWCCAERWERCEEKLFKVDPQRPSKMRQPPPHCHSPEHVVTYIEIPTFPVPSEVDEPKFIDTINPLLSFSNADLAEMNQEFDQFFESDSSSEDEHINIEIPPMDKILLKRKREEIDEDRQRKFFTKDDNASVLVNKDGDPDDERNNSDDDDDEPPSVKFRRGENLPSDLDIGSESEGSEDPIDDEDDGEWNMMGAALEREFLGLDN